eukprot:TRINITY_DN5161_c4_g1_i1.p1 TRINITY_DN5161_c4_g1~~TRINITY_DN5161_c4_g1_i1.p1  ORF type:complete len:516 (-),score=87.96 TRINITY_DN5161_c4_g1_i1:47-1594(-)
MQRLRNIAKVGVGVGIGGGAAAALASQYVYDVPEHNKRARPDAKTAIVIGGGVIGFSQARELCRHGYKVTLLESQAGPAEGASKAPAGHISVSAFHSSFASLSFVRKIGVSTFFNDARNDHVREPDDLAHNKFVKLATWFDWKFIAWGMAWCGLVLHNSRDLPLMESVRLRRVMDMKHALLAAAREEGLEKDCSMVREGGRLNVAFHTSHHSGFGLRPRDALANMTRKSAAEVVSKAPFLASAHDDGLIRGGVFANADAFADCKTYTDGLAERVESFYGATVRYHCKVDALETENGAMKGVRLRSGEVLSADVYVLATGADTPSIAATAGIHVPITAMNGYKVVAPVRSAELTPTTSVCLKPYELYITPLHQDLHFASFGEFSPSWDKAPTKELEDRLEDLVKLLFPHIDTIVDWEKRHHIFGRRPQTPDGNAILGPTRVDGLYLNAGHCSYGFRGATLSAQLLCNGLRNGFAANGFHDRLCSISRFKLFRDAIPTGAEDPENCPSLEELGKDRR